MTLDGHRAELMELKRLCMDLYYRAARRQLPMEPTLEFLRLLNAGAEARYGAPAAPADPDARTVVRPRPARPEARSGEAEDWGDRTESVPLEVARQAGARMRRKAGPRPREPAAADADRFQLVANGAGVNAVIDQETRQAVSVTEGVRAFPPETVERIKGFFRDGKTEAEIRAALYPPKPRIRVMGERTVSRVMRGEPRPETRTFVGPAPTGHIRCSGRSWPEPQLRRELCWAAFHKFAGIARGFPPDAGGFERYLADIPRIPLDWPDGWSQRLQLVTFVEGRISLEELVERLAHDGVEVRNHSMLPDWEDLDARRTRQDPYWIRCQPGGECAGRLRDARKSLRPDETGLFVLEALSLFVQYGEAVFRGLPNGILCDGDPEYPVTLVMEDGKIYIENASDDEAVSMATRGTLSGLHAVN